MVLKRKRVNGHYPQKGTSSLDVEAPLREIAMPCAVCRSGNQREFQAEVNIHISDLSDTGSSGVFVFAKVLVCLDCGYSSFTTPMSQLAPLSATDKPPA